MASTAVYLFIYFFIYLSIYREMYRDSTTQNKRSWAPIISHLRRMVAKLPKEPAIISATKY
jgi:hypothetical protein